MPIYEYKCLDCGTQVEKMQKISDEPLKTCERCGGKLEKQWSLSGFQFKGAGWYVTDYANKSTEPSGGKNASTEKSASNEKSENGEKSGKSGKSEKTEKTEKSSVAESTATTESASKQSSENAGGSKTESVIKKD